MKKYYKEILACLISIILVFSLTFNKDSELQNPVFKEEKKVNLQIEELIKLNPDKQLVINKQYGKLVYLDFKNEVEEISYFIDSSVGEVKNLESFIKEDKLEEFEQKIIELLNLKYPKFVVEALLSDGVTKEYFLKDNNVVIIYDNVNLDFQDETVLSLRVNFNEIKDFLEFEVELDNEYENENGYIYDKNKKTIAITFDDGPNGKRTNEILNILEENKAHATFFMVGNRMNSGASTILNVLNHNCEIGSHSYSHKSMKRQTLNDVLADEAKTEEIYRSITNQDLLYTRPPYGAIDSDIKNSLSNYIINWNVDPEDWLYRDKTKVVNSIMEHVSDGDIILLHDSYDSTVEAVRELLPKLYLQGYQVVSVGELAQVKGRNLELHTIYRSFKKS